MLNQPTLDQKIYDKETVFEALQKAGIHRFYERKNGHIVVLQSDVLKVRIVFRGNDINLQWPFSQWMILAKLLKLTLTIVVTFFFFESINLILLLIVGQILYSIWLYPKAKQFKDQVEAAIRKH